MNLPLFLKSPLPPVSISGLAESPPVCCFDRSGWAKAVWWTSRRLAPTSSISVKSVKGREECSVEASGER